MYNCIIVALEAINVFHKSCFAGNLTIKKAFDTLHWSFSLVLSEFGFVTDFPAKTRKYYTFLICQL